jgi:hypothetical protein
MVCILASYSLEILCGGYKELLTMKVGLCTQYKCLLLSEVKHPIPILHKSKHQQI